MTLIYSSTGYHGTRSGSPLGCASPIGCCPDYTVDDKAKNVDIRLSSNRNTTNTTRGITLSGRMRNGELRLSLEDLKTNLEAAAGKCTARPTSTTGFTLDKIKTKLKPLDITPRSILKKSISADAACLASLRDAILTTKRLSLSLSDTSLSSLKTQDDDEECCEEEARPRSPSKTVTFADDNNQSLVEVHNFVPSSENLNQWEFSIGRQTSFRSNRVSGNQSLVPSKVKVKKPDLMLCFTEPCDSPDFTDRFKYKCVALERCATRDRNLTGIILVKNIEYKKEVCVRYTLDNWKSTNDITACYVPNSNDRETDRFSFTLSLPKSYKEMEFAIRYKTGSSEFWDNNFNRNYKVRDICLLE